MRRIFVLILLLFGLSFKNALAEDAVLTINTASNLGVIKPIWRTTASWKSWVWVTTPMVANNPSPNWFTNYFPFFESIRIIAPLGGNTPVTPGAYCGKLFSCEVPEVLKSDGSYDFSFIDQAFSNMKNAGVYPSVDLGQIPITLSAAPLKYCSGLGWVSSSIRTSDDSVERWKNLLGVFIDRYRNLYGDDVTSKWNFSSFNEPDTGDPNLNACLSSTNTDPYCCSFTGTEEQFFRDIFLPTIGVLKNKNLLANFHLGAIETVRQQSAGSLSPENANGNLGSDQYLTYFFNKLTENGYPKGNFRSFAVNSYGVYPKQQNSPHPGSVFDIKRRLEQSRTLLQSKGYDLPIRSDELGIIHNYNSNTPVYDTVFAGSWFASVLKAYLDIGNIDRVSAWWYLLVRNGRTFDVAKWKRNFAYYTFLMYHQLADNQRLGVSGGIYNESTLYNIDAVAGKDGSGKVKMLVFNHHDGLTTASTSSDANAPIIDKSTKTVKLVFNNLNPGNYEMVVYQPTDANISSSPSSLPIVESQNVVVDSSGMFQKVLNMSHHSAFFITLERVIDSLQLRAGWNRTDKSIVGENTVLPTQCIRSFEKSENSFYLRCVSDVSWKIK